MLQLCCVEFVKLLCCVPRHVITLCPLILHLTARLIQAVRIPSVTQQKTGERRTEVVKMELNCQSSVVRLEFFFYC